MSPAAVSAAPAPERLRWLHAMRRIVPTGIAQAAVQLVGFLTGLVIIRSLPVAEYASYTLANAVLGTLTVLTDSGIGQSVLSEAGKVWTDPAALGAVLAAGVWLRRRLAIIALLFAMPATWELLIHHGAGRLDAALLCVSIVPVFVASLNGQLLQIVPRLHQQLRDLQGQQLVAGVARFGLTGAIVLLWPSAWTVTLCAAVTQIWLARGARRLAARHADLGTGADKAALVAIRRLVVGNCGNAIYYAFEGQIIIWLVSIFGKVSAVAEVGALGRLNMGFSILSATYGLVIAPQFSRLPDSPQVLRRYWVLQAGLAGILSLIVAAVACFPGVPLLLLGSAYGHLVHEVILSTIGGAFTVLSGCAYLSAAARGVVITPWFIVPFALTLQAVLVWLLPVDTVAGLLWLTILSNMAFWMAHVVNFARHSRR